MAMSAEDRVERERARKNKPEYRAAQRERNRLWRIENATRSTEYNTARAGCEAARKRAVYDADPVAKRTKVAKWKAANPEAKRAQDHARRAKLRGADGRWSPSDVIRLEVDQNGTCAYCDAPWNHRDHKTPLSVGGDNTAANLQLLCTFHNTSKGARTDAEYRARHNWPSSGKPPCSRGHAATEPPPTTSGMHAT